MRAALVTTGSIALAIAIWLGVETQGWNGELELQPPPIADVRAASPDPRTPALARRVVLIVVDGLGLAESHLPALDALRARGVGAAMRVAYPTISRPHYVTLVTGVPPVDSGVRTNRVARRVAVDSVMRHARSATASDYGSIASLFAAHDFATVARAEDLAELAGDTLILMSRPDIRFLPVLALDVDRAGHAGGVDADYRAAAPDYRAAPAAVDRAIGRIADAMDFAHDTLVVVADHGHVARGGHGGDEPEVSTVAFVAAGAGIRASAVAQELPQPPEPPEPTMPPESTQPPEPTKPTMPTMPPVTIDNVDVAPTVAALLGVPAPAHAEGRTRTELLALSPADAAARRADDTARLARLAPAVDREPRVSIAWALAAAAVLAGLVAARRQLGRAALVGIVPIPGMLLALLAIAHGHVSPSYIPSQARVQTLVVAGILASLALQLALAARARRPLAVALGGSLLALLALAAVRTAFSPPFYAVPDPRWMVLVPTLQLGVAIALLGNALYAFARALRRTPPSESRAPSGPRAR